MNKPNVTSWKTILSLAWPHAVMNMLFTLLMIVDMYWVGEWGGDDPINAIAICGPMLWSFQSAAMFIFYGVLAMVSRFVGSGNKESAERVGQQGLMVGLLLGSLIAFLGILFADPFLRFYETSASIHTMATSYLTILLGINPMYFFFMAIYAVFSSHNNTRDPMYMTLTAWVVNMILDPVLIFGIGPFPALGIDGAAWATFISYVLATAGFFLFFRKKLFKYVPYSSISSFYPHYTTIWEIIKIGTPASLNGVSRPLSAVVIMGLVAHYGTAVVAAFGVAVRIISINWIYLGGLNIAVSSLVGQNLGAGTIIGAENTVKRVWKLAMIIQIIVSTIIILSSNYIASAFSDTVLTVTETTHLLIILAIGTLADVHIAVYGGTLNGAGDTAKAMFSSIAANWIYKLPACYGAYYLFGTEPAYIYWLVSISIPAEGLLNYFWYKKGSWKKKKFNLSK